MVSFPNGKINIGLQIKGRRPDGYHDLETVFYPIRIHDILEIVDSAEYQLDETGISSGSRISENLCTRAWQLLKKDHPGLPAVWIHLHKSIPSGAGMGGGSSDASFCLKLLNKKYDLGISKDRLLKYALQLGSDCPFFIINKPCFATGTGDHLEETEIDLSAYRILIVNPGIHVSTTSIFSKIKTYSKGGDLKKGLKEPVNTWKEHIFNDLEGSASEAFPEIARLKRELYISGAIYVSMTGSGSTVFAIFDREMNPVLKFPSYYFQKWV